MTHYPGEAELTKCLFNIMCWSVAYQYVLCQIDILSLQQLQAKSADKKNIFSYLYIHSKTDFHDFREKYKTAFY